MTRARDHSTVVLRTTVDRPVYERLREAVPDGSTLSALIRDLLTNYLALHDADRADSED